MSTTTFTKSGSKASSAVSLNKEVFAQKVESHELLKQAYNAQQAASRSNNATTKLRGAVRGGGKKPWRQKGTGRARAGSIRSPLWRGGGITFGPSGNENYSKKINQQAKRKALKQALSLKAADSKVSVIEAFETKGKTSETVKLLEKIAPDSKRVVLIVDDFNELVDRATRNISNLKTMSTNYLNVVDVLDADTLVLTKPSLKTLEEWLGAKK